MPLESFTDWRERAINRLTQMELDQEAKRDKAEDLIKEIIGEVNSTTFMRLRSLFDEWQIADEKMALYGERLANL